MQLYSLKMATLLEIITLGDSEQLETQLNQGIDPNTVLLGRQGRNVLMECVMSHQEECAAILLCGKNINLCAVDEAGATVLHYAAEHGSTELMAQLLTNERSGNIINHQDKDGATPLHYAVSRDDVPLIGKLFLDTGKVDVNLADSDGYTALHVAAELDNVPMLQCLLETKHCDVNKPSRLHRTALHQAVTFASASAVQTILSDSDSSLGVNMTNCDKQTALHMACHYGTLEMLGRSDHYNLINEVMKIFQ